MVGAGPVGIVIALEAANRGFDVVLIESGHSKFHARTQQLSEAATWNADRHAPMSMAVRRQLGGTSTIWGGRCVPFDKVDFDRRRYITDIDWPLTYEELSPYFQRACSWLQCGRAVFDVTGMTHLPPSMVPGLIEGDASTATLERWSLSTDFAREYAHLLKESRRIRVITGLTCTEVMSRHSDGHADRLTCRTLDGKQLSIQARAYVLACGGLETTRLMLASRGPHGRPLGNHSGHLGSWYMGHVDGVIANARFQTTPRSTVFGYERDIDGIHVRRRFSINRKSQIQHEVPNVIAFLANPDLADYRHGNGVLSFAYLALRSPLGQRISPPAQRMSITGDGLSHSTDPVADRALIRSHLMNIVSDGPSVTRFAVDFGVRRLRTRGRKMPGFFAAYSRDNLYPLQYSGEHLPNRQSHVSLSSQRDSVGMPKLNIELRFSQQDVDGVLRCHEIWDSYLRQSGCGHLEYKSQDPASLVWSRLGGGTHQLGTTRMAARPEDGVVDADLAVHGMRNLFVASSSVFVTSSQANPTFMVIVLALRLVDRLDIALGAL